MVEVEVNFSYLCSFHIQDKPFQVLALGMIDVDGMIGRLVKLMQDANLALGLCCSSEDSQAELVLVDSL